MDQYVYKVKIFNPTKKRDFVVRQLHHFNGKFACIQHVKEILVKEYKSEIPDNMTNVGYFEGRSHTKRWIATQEDLTAMYARFSPGNEIFLWCIGKEEEEEELSHQHGVKRKSDGAVNKRQAREDELDSIYDRLKEKHGDMYSTPKYRLWARMIICGTHDDLDTPPQVPMIFGAPLPKRPKQESLTSAKMLLLHLPMSFLLHHVLPMLNLQLNHQLLKFLDVEYLALESHLDVLLM